MAADFSQVRQFLTGLVSATARVEGELKTIAHRRARAVQLAAQSKVRVRTGLTRESIVVVDDSANKQFIVEVRDMTGRMPMLPVWIEFGTRNMPARPFMGPALFESRDAYVKEAEALVAKIDAEAQR